ncbi:hypothetical protein MXB_3494, partial [Myxobolus squamalis]
FLMDFYRTVRDNVIAAPNAQAGECLIIPRDILDKSQDECLDGVLIRVFFDMIYVVHLFEFKRSHHYADDLAHLEQLLKEPIKCKLELEHKAEKEIKYINDELLKLLL